MRWFAGSALALAWCTSPALADEAGTEPLTLRYEAPAMCPDSAAFFEQVRARTTRVRAPKDGESARTLVVRIAPVGRGFVGHLHFEDAGTTTSPRVFEMSSCAEVIEALGLSAALAVDPSASTAPADSLPASLPPPSPPPPSSPPPPPPPPAPPPSTSVGPPIVAAPTPAERPTSRPLDARFGAGIAVEAASLGTFIPSGRVFLEATMREHAPVFAPSLRVFVTRSLDVDQSPHIGTASMRWTTGGIDACPIRVPFASTLAFRPCLEAAAGTIAAQVSGVDAAKNRSRAWVTVDIHGRLSWELARFVALDAEAGAVAPLVRETFFFLPSTDVYQADTIGVFGRAGATVRFP